MTPDESFKNLGPIMLFVIFGLRILSIPGGMLVFFLVRRMMPFVNMITVGIAAGFVVCFVVLYVVVRKMAPELGWYDAASISLVVTSGLIFFISYLVKRSLYAHADKLTDDQVFKVDGLDMRKRPKNLRRR